MTRKRLSDAPKHLHRDTRAWFRAVIETWTLEDHHLRLLTLAAESWDRATMAREALLEHGMTFTDRFHQPRARPEVAIERDSRIAFARLLRELNLDGAGNPDNRPPRLGGQRY